MHEPCYHYLSREHKSRKKSSDNRFINNHLTSSLRPSRDFKSKKIKTMIQYIYLAAGFALAVPFTGHRSHRVASHADSGNEFTYEHFIILEECSDAEREKFLWNGGHIIQNRSFYEWGIHSIIGLPLRWTGMRTKVGIVELLKESISFCKRKFLMMRS